MTNNQPVALTDAQIALLQANFPGFRVIRDEKPTPASLKPNKPAKSSGPTQSGKPAQSKKHTPPAEPAKSQSEKPSDRVEPKSRKPIKLIVGPKPKGSAGRGGQSGKGYNLRKALGMKQATYTMVRSTIERYCGRRLNVTKCMRGQSDERLREVYGMTLAKYPEFKPFHVYNYWPIKDFVQSILKYLAAKNKKLDEAGQADRTIDEAGASDNESHDEGEIMEGDKGNQDSEDDEDGKNHEGGASNKSDEDSEDNQLNSVAKGTTPASLSNIRPTSPEFIARPNQPEPELGWMSEDEHELDNRDYTPLVIPEPRAQSTPRQSRTSNTKPIPKAGTTAKGKGKAKVSTPESESELELPQTEVHPAPNVGKGLHKQTEHKQVLPTFEPTPLDIDCSLYEPNAPLLTSGGIVLGLDNPFMEVNAKHTEQGAVLPKPADPPHQGEFAKTRNTEIILTQKQPLKRTNLEVSSKRIAEREPEPEADSHDEATSPPPTKKPRNRKSLDKIKEKVKEKAKEKLRAKVKSKATVESQGNTTEAATAKRQRGRAAQDKAAPVELRRSTRKK